MQTRISGHGCGSYDLACMLVLIRASTVSIVRMTRSLMRSNIGPDAMPCSFIQTSNAARLHLSPPPSSYQVTST
jgi:hypothetical protein